MSRKINHVVVESQRANQQTYSGGNGFVGTEIVVQFAKNGYTVRATARSAEKIAAWQKIHPEASSVECANTLIFDRI